MIPFLIAFVFSIEAASSATTPSPIAWEYVGCYNKYELINWFDGANIDLNEEHWGSYDGGPLDCKKECEDLHYDYVMWSRRLCTCGNWKHGMDPIEDTPSNAESKHFNDFQSCLDHTYDFTVWYLPSADDIETLPPTTPSPTVKPTVKPTAKPTIPYHIYDDDGTSIPYVGCYNKWELRSWFGANFDFDEKHWGSYDGGPLDCKKQCHHYDYMAVNKRLCTCGNWIHSGSIDDTPSHAEDFHFNDMAQCQNHTYHFTVWYVPSEDDNIQTLSPTTPSPTIPYHIYDQDDTHIGCFRSGRGSRMAFADSMVGVNLSFKECAEACDRKDLDYVAIKKGTCFCGDYHAYGLAVHHGRKTNCHDGMGGEEAFDIYHIGSEQEGVTNVIGAGKTAIL